MRYTNSAQPKPLNLSYRNQSLVATLIKKKFGLWENTKMERSLCDSRALSSRMDKAELRRCNLFGSQAWESERSSLIDARFPLEQKCQKEPHIYPLLKKHPRFMNPTPYKTPKGPKPPFQIRFFQAISTLFSSKTTQDQPPPSHLIFPANHLSRCTTRAPAPYSNPSAVTCWKRSFRRRISPALRLPTAGIPASSPAWPRAGACSRWMSTTPTTWWCSDSSATPSAPAGIRGWRGRRTNRSSRLSRWQSNPSRSRRRRRRQGRRGRRREGSGGSITVASGAGRGESSRRRSETRRRTARGCGSGRSRQPRRPRSPTIRPHTGCEDPARCSIFLSGSRPPASFRRRLRSALRRSRRHHRRAAHRSGGSEGSRRVRLNPGWILEDPRCALFRTPRLCHLANS